MKTINIKAFTIVELVIVIAVIAVLAATLVPAFSGIVDKANDSKAKQEAKHAYDEYLAENIGKEDVQGLFFYKIDENRVVAIQKGVPLGVYDGMNDAVKTITGKEYDDDKLCRIDNGNLFVYHEEWIDSDESTAESELESTG